MTFPIYSGARITTVDDWGRLAPPAHEKHWREGRSAMELARRWVDAANAGRVPAEVARILDQHPDWRGFVPQRAFAETQTRLDELKGETRNHDLVVTGSVGKLRAVLDVEGKVDESFNLSLGDRERAAVSNPRTKVPERIEWLTNQLLGMSRTDVPSLRYQLLYGAAAAVLRAVEERAERVAFLVHTFPRAGDADAMALNRGDLHEFVAALARATGDARPLDEADEFLRGPFLIPGGDRLPSSFPLYVGAMKATTT